MLFGEGDFKIIYDTYELTANRQTSSVIKKTKEDVNRLFDMNNNRFVSYKGSRDSFEIRIVQPGIDLIQTCRILNGKIVDFQEFTDKPHIAKCYFDFYYDDINLETFDIDELIISLSAVYYNPQISTSLFVGYYDFSVLPYKPIGEEQLILDKTVNRNHLEISGTYSLVDGVFGQGIQLVSPDIDTPFTSIPCNKLHCEDGFTVAFWVKLSGASHNIELLRDSCVMSGDITEGFTLDVNNGTFSLNWMTSEGIKTLSKTPTEDLLSFNLICVIVDGSRIGVYLNGNQLFFVTGMIIPNPLTGCLSLYKTLDSIIVDGVKLYREAISLVDVGTLYGDGTGYDYTNLITQPFSNYNYPALGASVSTGDYIYLFFTNTIQVNSIRVYGAGFDFEPSYLLREGGYPLWDSTYISGLIGQGWVGSIPTMKFTRKLPETSLSIGFMATKEDTEKPLLDFDMKITVDDRVLVGVFNIEVNYMAQGVNIIETFNYIKV